MRRLYILALALLALALMTTPAGAGVKGHKVGQSKAAVKRYWTAERMRDARPAERVRTNGGKVTQAKKGGGTTLSWQVMTDYTVFPTSTHGKVFFTEGTTNYVCSGTALLSANESAVWTAGHCVHGGGSGAEFHTNWMFVPAYKDNNRPYGNFVASELYTTDGWLRSGDFEYDLGAARVTPNTSTLTDTVGGRGIAFDQARQQTYRAYGYPAASPFNGQRLWYCEAAPTYTDGAGAQATMGIPCDMTGGSSGGGWVVGANVLSVNSYHYRSLRNVMFGPYQGSAAKGLYTTAASG